MPRPDDGHPARYRYEVTVRAVIGADGLDKATQVARRLADTLAEDEDVVVARVSVFDVKHRNDLDGALAP